RWERRLREEMPAETFNKIHDQDNLWQWVKLATDPERAWSTVNFIAQDSHGDIAAGVSTSGWAWKYPGRVGDSPIIGAGIYADNRYGAATCTGMGEMAIRACTAHSLVFYMKMGQSVQTAATQAMRDLNDLGGRFISRMNLIALDKEGNHIGCTSVKGYTYIYQTTDMAEHVEVERTYVEIVERWDRIIENE
ncbi:MAG: isoaspartyl peptidase/L-asparaginase, partial [Methylococcales bacterium]|nr:isoaspartyl peptidase/L-asparaginase [Methylococcales bacterium]